MSKVGQLVISFFNAARELNTSPDETFEALAKVSFILLEVTKKDEVVSKVGKVGDVYVTISKCKAQ